MTGFGKGECNDGKRHVTVEIRSVNHRYSDIFIKAARRYAFAEEAVKKTVKEKIQRGKIEVSLNIDAITETDSFVDLNEMVARQYVDRLSTLKEHFHIQGEINLELLASLPDVLKVSPHIEDEEEVKRSIIIALTEALKEHDTMRKNEGAKLKEDLLERSHKISGCLEEIKKRAPKISRLYTEKLERRIDEILEGKVEVLQERILLEAAIFADKSDISEEIVRLESHINQLQAILDQEQSQGKKLDFLVQEMNREANTIGSKANDLDITGVVLDIKSEVEKIREQVQNVE